MSIVFSVDETTHFTAWPSSTALLSYGEVLYSLQEGDRICWHQADLPGGVALDAWIDAASGSRWHFLQLVLADNVATETRGRLMDCLDALGEASGCCVAAAGAGPGPVCLVGTVGGESIARGKTLATWNGIPSGSPYFELTVRGLGRPVQICPGWSAEECLPAVTNPERRALLDAARAVLAAARDARVRVVGQWSRLRVVPPDTPDMPRQRPISTVEPLVMAELTADLEALLGEPVPTEPGRALPRTLAAPTASGPRASGMTIDPVVFFWCTQATCLS